MPAESSLTARRAGEPPALHSRYFRRVESFNLRGAGAYISQPNDKMLRHESMDSFDLIIPHVCSTWLLSAEQIFGAPGTDRSLHEERIEAAAYSWSCTACG